MHLPIKQRPYSSHAPNWRRLVGRKRCHLPAGRSFSQATPFRLYLARVLRGAYLKKREERFPLSFSFIHLISSSSLLLSLHFRSYSLTLPRRKPSAISPPLSPLPYSHLIPRYVRVSYVDTGESNPLRHSGHVSTAFFRDASPLRGVNFSYGHPPLSLQLSSSRMEFLRFRRTLCNTLYSRDEQGEREGGRQEGTAGFHNRCLSLSPVLIHWTITLDCVCLSSEYMVEVYSLGLARWRVCLIRFDSI